MRNISIIDIIVAIIAFWGAALSTIIFIRDIIKSKSKIELSIYKVVQEHPTKKTLLTYTIVNLGSKSITLYSPNIQLPGGLVEFSYDVKGDIEFPYTLKRGKNIFVWSSYDELIKDIRAEGYEKKTHVISVVEDQIGNIYKSKKLYIDL